MEYYVVGLYWLFRAFYAKVIISLPIIRRYYYELYIWFYMIFFYGIFYSGIAIEIPL